jgi:hypothetical protein
MAQLDLPPKDPMLVESLAVSAGAVAPVGDGPFVEPEGGDDGLDRTAVAEQGDDDGDQVERLLQAVERGVASGGKGPATGRASVATLLSARNADIPAAELSPCGAFGWCRRMANGVGRGK